MKNVGVFASVVSTLSLALALGACSSATPGTEQDKGLEGNGVGTPTGKETNPDGVPYPTTRIGTKPATHEPPRQGTPGDVMKNFKFYGYPKGDKSQGLQQVSLADYFDPQTKNFRLIHIQAAAVWCGPCNQEAKAAASIAGELKEKKVAWLAVLVETAKRGSPSTQGDLDKWLSAYPSDFSHVLDPNNAQFGVFFDAAAVPWNAQLDARTMEILHASTGGPGTAEGVRTEVDGWLKFLDGYAPAK
ncbi:MAG: redoxin domain-containing protein [Myxococcales bacterium]|nr:redoxin domain-containing protein [Myxococcales bacterium]